MSRFQSRSALVLASALALAAGSARAQAPKPAAPAQAAPAPVAPAPAPAAAPAAPQGPIKAELAGLGEWIKVCGKDQAAQKEVCYTTRDFGQPGDNQPVLAMAVYDVKGDKQKVMRMLMPVGLLLKPGFKYALDKSAALPGNFEICFPNGCFAEAKFEQAGVDALKKATVLNIAVQNQGGAEVNFSLQLAGFGKAFDGPAIDPKIIEEQQKLQSQKLDEELKKRAEALKAQESAQPAPAPAAPAPATPVPATPLAPAKP